MTLRALRFSLESALFAEYGIGVRSEPVKFYQVDGSKYDFLK
jgi:hypothetical protein